MLFVCYDLVILQFVYVVQHQFTTARQYVIILEVLVNLFFWGTYKNSGFTEYYRINGKQ